MKMPEKMNGVYSSLRGIWFLGEFDSNIIRWGYLHWRDD
jgi:hypothetical protein